MPEVTCGLRAAGSLCIGNVMLLVLNLPMARVWAELLQIPAYGIYGAIMVFATLGTFATTLSVVLWAVAALALVVPLALSVVRRAA